MELSEPGYARKELVRHIGRIRSYHARMVALRTLASWDDKQLMSCTPVNDADGMIELLIRRGNDGG